MNQITCPNCKHRVNHTAHCSDCGAPIPARNPLARLDTNNTLALFGCVGLFLVVILIGSLAGKKGDSTPPPVSTPKPEPAKIDAAVKFDGKQFIITNKNTYDWSDVTLEVNDRFELKHSTIKAGTTYTVGGLQFSDSDGVRFNPFQLKAKEFSICIRLPKIDCYSAEWE